MRIKENKKQIIGMVVVALISGIIGYLLNSFLAPDKNQQVSSNHLKAQKEIQWTCSMHPQIKLPQKGICPICNMDLIPLDGGGAVSESERPVLHLSEYARALAGVETQRVLRRDVSKEIRLVGKVQYDETGIKHITSWTPGRIDRLYVDYTGMNVRKGDHLYEIFSPELFAAQEEYIQAIETVKVSKRSGHAENVNRSTENYRAIREKLLLWGLNQKQLDDIEKSKQPSSHVTIFSPSGGTVIEKSILEGEYVKTGTKLLTIANLETVWVSLDAYESDVSWLGFGQTVEFRTYAHPGIFFTGTIVFISPYLDKKTRTFQVRINVTNPGMKLKPEMFVKATVNVPVNRFGLPLSYSLSGKWVCPMHPESVQNKKGSCPVCQMDLEKVPEERVQNHILEKTFPLVIPHTAPLITGKRAVVYIKTPGDEGHYEGREVVLGPRAGDYFIVKKGLDEDDEVVVKGNFKIDSALQILAKPSMMSLPSEPVEEDFSKQDMVMSGIQQIIDSYLELQKSLSRDKFKRASENGKALTSSFKRHMDELKKSYPNFNEWEKLAALSKRIEDSKTIEEIRKEFSSLSESFIRFLKLGNQNGVNGDFFVYRCPMAFDFKGARWIQSRKGTENPYFGRIMFKCGTMVDTITGKEDKKK